MVLYIDTTDFGKITFAVADGEKLWEKSYKIDPHKSHETLECLEKFFKANKIGRGRVKKIAVNKGPGSYTGTRVGVVMGQALGFAWGVPVKFLPKDKMPAL